MINWEFISSNTYIQGIVVFMLFLVISWIVAWLIKNMFRKFIHSSEARLNDLVVKRLGGPIIWAVLFGGIIYSINISKFEHPLLDEIIKSTIIFIITYCIMVGIDILIDIWGYKIVQKTKSRFDDALLPLFHGFSKVIVLSFGFLFILKTWGVEVGPLFAGLGIAGIAVAFALQNTLGNILGGVSLILDKNFNIGDVIRTESGEEGEIIDIGLRSTKIQTFDNELLIVPNGVLANQKLFNYALPTPKIRISVNISVAYGSDIEKVKKILLESTKKIDGFISSPAPDVLFNKLGSSSLDFTLRFYTDRFKDIRTVRSNATEIVYKNLTNAGIEIPFPITTVIMENKK